MIFRKKVKSTAVAIAVLLGTSTTIFANQRYIDVPNNHWGHESIINVSEKGYMVGNTIGEFRPNNPMDKFDTARILAMAAGFKHTGLSQEEEAFIERAYENHLQILQQKNSQLVRWNPTANREIAFLLEMGILLEEDLSHFIIINDGQEQLRALSRQEASVFLVRLIGLTEAASAGSYAQLFNDDHNIAPEKRHYVYFLRANNVISGDTNNNFNPNEAVARAAFAVMLDRTLSLGESTYWDNTYEDFNGGTITGTITVLYPSLNAVQIRTDENQQGTIFRLRENSSIFVNNSLVPFSDLEEGMNVVAIIENREIVNIRTVESQDNTTSETLPIQPSIQQSSNQTTIQPAAELPIENKVLQTIQGVINSTRVDENNNRKSIDVEVRFLTPGGSIVSQIITYNLAQTYEITRAGQDIAFDIIRKGDIATVKVWGTYAYEIDIAEPHRQFEGVLVEKGHNQILDAPVFIVEDKDGVKHEFIISEGTILTREGSGTVTWNQIRIGDTVDIIAHHNKLIEAYAYGTRSTVDGIVEEIRITQDRRAIVVSNNNIRLTYYIMSDLEGINRLTVGNRVRLRLDSREVESFSILQQ